jgi:hypothetical protein
MKQIVMKPFSSLLNDGTLLFNAQLNDKWLTKFSYLQRLALLLETDRPKIKKKTKFCLTIGYLYSIFAPVQRYVIKDTAIAYA